MKLNTSLTKYLTIKLYKKLSKKISRSQQLTEQEISWWRWLKSQLESRH